MGTTEQELTGRARLKGGWLASRPQFVMASVVPALLGQGAAIHDGAQYDPVAGTMTILGVMAIHAGANAFNDCHDVASDSINRDHISPFSGGSRVIQRGLLSLAQQRVFALALLGLGILCGLWLLRYAGAGLLWVGIGGLFLAWAYSAPPLRLSSRGMGELAVGVAFGILVPLGSYLVLTGRFGLMPVWAGLPYALLTSAVLIAAQFPDRPADIQAGKRNWVVRLDPGHGRMLYVAVVGIAWLCLVGLVAASALPATALMALPASVMSLLAIRAMWLGEGKAELKAAVQHTIGALLVSGLIMALALVISS